MIEESQDRTSPLADPAKRLGASAIDFAASTLPASTVGVLAFVLGRGTLAALVPTVLAVTLVFVLPIQLMLLARHGQTIGKRAIGLRILRSDGSRVGLARIVLMRMILTYAASGIPIVGPLFAIADVAMVLGAQRRALHDRIADTIVVSLKG